MSLHRKTALASAIVGSLLSPVWAYDFGRPATPEEIELWDIDVWPDGQGLPEGRRPRHARVG
jgi:S-disulfanyl-L-cysteine oxidoreductase SoxD